MDNGFTFKKNKQELNITEKKEYAGGRLGTTVPSLQDFWSGQKVS